MQQFSSFLITTAIALASAGCVSTTIVKDNAIEALTATEEIPEHQLLDVGVAIFDPGIPETDEELEKKNIFPGVRNAEARYIPYALKNTMQGTGYWGAVRVIPRDTNSVDLLVSGEIVNSDGETLTVRVTAVDATGRRWLDKEYSDRASKYAYEKEQGDHPDPFQDIYNMIANDLVAAGQLLSDQDLQRIRTVSELRFARELSPEVFDGYLEEAEGAYEVRRLPAGDDPMVARMKQIREREYIFIDTLDGHYADFHADMLLPYEEWRKYTYEETLALREMQRQARLRKILGAAAVVGAVVVDSNSSGSTGRVASNAMLIGGITAFKSGMDLKAESKIHAEALKELGGSFAAEVEPLVVDIEGRTVTLSGSVDAQFEEWRRLLREIYAAETGFAADAPGAGDDEDGALRAEF